MALVGMSMAAVDGFDASLTCIGVLPMPLVLVRFPDMLQVVAYAHEESESKESAKVESEESILNQCKLAITNN